MIEVKIDGARGVLFSVAGGYDMAMSEIQDAAEIITGAVAPDANIIFGASIRPELEDEIVVTVVATGFDSEYYRKLDAERLANEQMQRVETLTVGDVAGSETTVSSPYGGPSMNSMSAMSGREQEPAEPEAPQQQAPETNAADFTAEPRANMWDSIRTDNEDDLDVPPTLRERLRGKNKE